MVVVLAWVLALAGYALADTTDYIGEDGEPRLLFIWQSLLWFVNEGDVIARIFAGLASLVAICIQALAALHRRVYSVVAISAACLIGIIACVTVMIVTADERGEVIRSLRATVENIDAASLSNAIQLFMGTVVVWFVGFMGAQLRISFVKKNGALHAFFKKRRQEEK
ncbi:MAG: hypothetical protein H7210_01530 [Pyrinomonadaceae bacterium]|nr:hypothetical protein [Phycisphaerales bacterium]